VFRERLVKDGLVIALSRTQFRLLFLLAQNLGCPVSSGDLIGYVWGDNEFRNDLYVYINRIRQRLEKNPKSPKYLMSLRGMGYILFFIKD
jgi:DNA-binding response OmpR family regulator